MSLFFTLRGTTSRTQAVAIGNVEIQRQDQLNLTDPTIADAVCDYTVRIDGHDVATVQHRYGDGAWALVEKAAAVLAQHPEASVPRRWIAGMPST